MFLKGKTPSAIAKHLTEKKIPTPGKKEKWSVSTVLSILANVKYKGDALPQRTLTIDFLTKKSKVNEGEVPQYYIEEGHPAIISPEMFDLVQVELQRHNEKRKRTVKQEGILQFLTELDERGVLTEFDEGLWVGTVENMTVGLDWGVVVAFKDGSEVLVGLGGK